jgi:hypothetical protein
VLNLSQHERRWLAMTSAIPFILRQAQDERDSLNLLAKRSRFYLRNCRFTFVEVLKSNRKITIFYGLLKTKTTFY